MSISVENVYWENNLAYITENKRR